MKEVMVAKTCFGGERSESSCPQMPGNTASELLSSFTPVAQINEFTLLLSTFTHTRANARAYPRESARVREGGEGRKKSWRSSRPRHANVTQMPQGRPRWHDVAAVRGVASFVPTTHATRHVATRWQARQPRAGSRFLTGQKSPEMAVGTDAVGQRVSFRV